MKFNYYNISFFVSATAGASSQLSQPALRHMSWLWLGSGARNPWSQCQPHHAAPRHAVATLPESDCHSQVHMLLKKERIQNGNTVNEYGIFVSKGSLMQGLMVPALHLHPCSI